MIGLFYAVAYWNAFFSALLYLNDSKLWPLQLVLRTYVINDTQLGSAELGTELLPPQAVDPDGDPGRLDRADPARSTRSCSGTSPRAS